MKIQNFRVLNFIFVETLNLSLYEHRFFFRKKSHTNKLILANFVFVIVFNLNTSITFLKTV